MNTQQRHVYINYLIAFVWLVNGLYCKLFNFVPRHQEIVGEILTNEFAFVLTKIIGLSEILMAFWIVSKVKPKLNAVFQITIIAGMNILEFILVPNLLLWGRFNSLFAFAFICLIIYNEFLLGKKIYSKV
jgi:DoxX-like family